jgi:Sigma-70 region 2
MTEEEFDELRPSAFAIAYRMLGSVSEAEDVVHEGLLRLHRARAGGERPFAGLCTSPRTDSNRRPPLYEEGPCVKWVGL